jgi:2-keto-4-pentenoate hydratase
MSPGAAILLAGGTRPWHGRTMSASEAHLLAIADRLALCRATLAPVSVPPAERPADEAEAYRVQSLLHGMLERAGAGPRIGWKIGCTTAVMRAYLGIGSPCAGGVFSRGRHASGASLPASGFRRIGIECEIAVELGRDLDGPADLLTPEVAGRAVRRLRPAIEIVDDRYADWREAGTTTLIADDFFAAGCVLGDAVPPSSVPDLASLQGRILVNGEEVGHGSGADVMGHPYAALAWLARSLLERGERLRKGDLVLTGSLVQTRWLQAGDRARIEISGLGAVDLAVT